MFTLRKFFKPFLLPGLSLKVFWLLLIFFHLLGFAQALHTGSIYLVDSIDYLSQAENLKHHGSLYAAPWFGPIKPDYYTFRPPIYGLLILGIKTLVQTDYAILFVQLLISLSTFGGVLKLAGDLGCKAPQSRTLLLLISLLYPSQIIHCNFVMSDILFQSLLFWSFYYSYHLWVNPKMKYSLLAALFFALAMLTKPVAFLLGISYAILFFMAHVWGKKSLLVAPTAKPIYILLLPFLLLPFLFHTYASYNQKITGYYHYSSVTPIFVLKYMAKYTNGQLYGEAYADSVQEVIMLKANQAKTYQERYEFMNQSGKEILAQHPIFFAWFNIKGWIALMLDPGRFEWVHFLNMEEGNYLGLYHVIHTQGLVNGLIHFMKNAPMVLLGVLLLCFLWNLFLAAVFLLFLFNKHQNLVLKIVLFLFVAYLLASTGVLGLSRYRVALAPLLWLSLLAFFVTPKTPKHGAAH